ncbi:MAG: hypothetical protein AB7F75_08145 [Planctomycetota bacterium]
MKAVLDWPVDIEGAVVSTQSQYSSVTYHFTFGFGAVSQGCPQANATSIKELELHRQYDPYTGRWLQRDPVYFGEASRNLYGGMGARWGTITDPYGDDILDWWHTGEWTPSTPEAKAAASAGKAALRKSFVGEKKTVGGSSSSVISGVTVGPYATENKGLTGTAKTEKDILAGTLNAEASFVAAEGVAKLTNESKDEVSVGGQLAKVDLCGGMKNATVHATAHVAVAEGTATWTTNLFGYRVTFKISGSAGSIGGGFKIGKTGVELKGGAGIGGGAGVEWVSEE